MDKKLTNDELYVKYERLIHYILKVIQLILYQQIMLKYL